MQDTKINPHMSANPTPFYCLFEGTNWYLIDTEIGSQAKPVDLDYWTYLKQHEGDWSDTSCTKPSKDAIKGAFASQSISKFVIKFIDL
jgi:hypothetical protein